MYAPPFSPPIIDVEPQVLFDSTRGKVKNVRFNSDLNADLFEELGVSPEVAGDSSVRFVDRSLGLLTIASNSEGPATHTFETPRFAAVRRLKSAWNRLLGRDEEDPEFTQAHLAKQHRIDVRVFPSKPRLTTQAYLHEVKHLADRATGNFRTNAEFVQRRNKFIALGLGAGALVAAGVIVSQSAWITPLVAGVEIFNWSVAGGFIGNLLEYRTQPEERRAFAFMKNPEVLAKYGNILQYERAKRTDTRIARIGAAVRRTAYRVGDPVHGPTFEPTPTI